ncbi:unnamed protein product [Alopecurus aequalis]
MVAFRKFGVQDHIDGTVDGHHHQYDAEWIQIDYNIVSWLYTSVSQEIVDIILKPDDTDFGVWTAIHIIFLGNRNQRAVYALQEFHNLYQGDTSITAYFSRLKLLADTLRDIGAPVSDQGQVLNMIHGLHSRFSHAISVMTHDDLPTFFNARTYLLQEERRLAHMAATEANHAMYARAPSSTPAPGISPTPDVNDNGKKKGRQKNKKRKGNTSGGTGGGQAPLRPYIAALAGLFQAVSFPRPQAPRDGILGSAPGVPAPASFHVVHAPGAHQNSYGMPPRGYSYGVPPLAPAGYSFVPGAHQHVPGASQPAPLFGMMPGTYPQYDHNPQLQALANLAQ